jgi:cytochrome c556
LKDARIGDILEFPALNITRDRLVQRSFPSHPHYPTLISLQESLAVNRKWICFAAATALVAACGLVSGLSRAQDQGEKHKEKETPLGKIMKKVQKHNISITKATRNVASFKKNQKDVEKAATELAKLAKEAKPFKDALKNARNETDPEKKWDEIMDAFAKQSQELADAAAKDGTTQKQVKDQFQRVKKTCSDCHTVFRVEEEF